MHIEPETLNKQAEQLELRIQELTDLEETYKKKRDKIVNAILAISGNLNMMVVMAKRNGNA